MATEARREQSAQKSISKRLALEKLTGDLELGRVDPKQRTAHGAERRTVAAKSFDLLHLSLGKNTSELEGSRSGWSGSWLWKQSTR